MIIAIVQAIGFFNSFNNPIVYAFMNENFKKSCVSTLSHCIRKPNQQGGAAVGPRLSVQFIKPQCREAFLESDEGKSSEPHSAVKGPSSSSHGESSLEIIGEKISCIQTELPANSSSQVKWEATGSKFKSLAVHLNRPVCCQSLELDTASTRWVRYDFKSHGCSSETQKVTQLENTSAVFSARSETVFSGQESNRKEI